jgi:hypothetical protein
MHTNAQAAGLFRGVASEATKRPRVSAAPAHHPALWPHVYLKRSLLEIALVPPEDVATVTSTFPRVCAGETAVIEVACEGDCVIKGIFTELLGCRPCLWRP